MIFGSTIKETWQAFSNKKEYANSKKTKLNSESQKKIAIFRLIITFIFVFIACYLLYLDNNSQSAMTIIGFISGYWLK